MRCGYRARLDPMSRWLRICAAALLLAASVGHAEAARVGVLANRYFDEAAADFNARLPGHTFTAVDVSTTVPTLQSLNASFDVLADYLGRMG